MAKSPKETGRTGSTLRRGFNTKRGERGTLCAEVSPKEPGGTGVLCASFSPKLQENTGVLCASFSPKPQVYPGCERCTHGGIPLVWGVPMVGYAGYGRYTLWYMPGMGDTPYGIPWVYICLPTVHHGGYPSCMPPYCTMVGIPPCVYTLLYHPGYTTVLACP